MHDHSATALAGICALVSFSISITEADRTSAQSTSRVSVDSTGIQGSRYAERPTISADARFVAFVSASKNLVPGDPNNFEDVFVHDRATGETTCASVNSTGEFANRRLDVSLPPSTSADGRFVLFTSFATNLAPLGDDRGTDVFVHDRLSRETTCVSVDSNGVKGNDWSHSSSISADGRFVTFSSSSNNLVADDRNETTDVFVHDRLTGETTRVSVDSSGIPANGYSINPLISGDGRFVAFDSAATNLVPGEANGDPDVFVHDRLTGETTRVSVDSAGVQGGGHTRSPHISADGRHVAFTSIVETLVPDDTNRRFDVFVHDRLTQLTTRVSVSSEGAQGNNESQGSSISGDGRLVTFAGPATNLVSGDTNGAWDVFVHDRQTGVTTLVSVDSHGDQGSRDRFDAAISQDGSAVAFTSGSDGLVAGDTNGKNDIFVRDLPADCRDGNVNAGAGRVTDVLFVNDSPGDRARTVRLLTHEPLTIFMAAPPAATRAEPFALYAWSVLPSPGARPFALPFALGETCLPTPLSGGSPAPRVIWNNTRSALLGAPTRQSSPAPSIVLRRTRALGRPADVFLQGIIRDAGAPNGRASVTNGVAIAIR